ncbi:uncharacterized protein LOC135939884 [Cloeon dipterum]|uniref:uncharacterized protein LOC135939884 n=1 Tax=Cloeon dipterum TaxID=197152 RepID=UPI00321F8FB6
MYNKALSGLIVCCTLLSAAESQVVITDAAPTEFPNIVKLMFNDQTVLKTAPGVFVSAKYILTSLTLVTELTKDSFQVTDQLDFVYPVGAYKAAEANNPISYLKVCTAFKGTPMNMSESSFDALATNVSAQMLFFPTTSNTLKKVSVTILDNTTCVTQTAEIGCDAAKCLCVTPDAITNFCLDTFKDADASNITYSAVAIGGQVNGLHYYPNCDGNDLSSSLPIFLLHKISYYRQYIIDLIPTVDIV